MTQERRSFLAVVAALAAGYSLGRTLPVAAAVPLCILVALLVAWALRPWEE